MGSCLLLLLHYLCTTWLPIPIWSCLTLHRPTAAHTQFLYLSWHKSVLYLEHCVPSSTSVFSPLLPTALIFLACIWPELKLPGIQSWLCEEVHSSFFWRRVKVVLLVWNEKMSGASEILNIMQGQEPSGSVVLLACWGQEFTLFQLCEIITFGST